MMSSYDAVWNRAPAIVGGVGLAIASLLLAFALPADGKSRKDQADAVGPLDLAKVSVTQLGRNTHVLLRTRGRWRFSQLDLKPQLKRAVPPNHLCLELRQDGRRSRSCFGSGSDGKPRVVGGKVAGSGKVRKYSGVAVERVKRPNRRSIEAIFPSEVIGLRPGGFRWRAISGSSHSSCSSIEPPTDKGPGYYPRPGARHAPTQQDAAVTCSDRVPDQGSVKDKLRQLQIVGCTRDESLANRHGSRGKRQVALTFDDGPSQYTGRVMEILDRHQAKGTFYVIGSAVSGRGSLLRRMLRGGHEIGNHSMNHVQNPSHSNLAATNQRIRDATGFTPCTFRPPYGALSSATAGAAWQLGMSNILWDIDTRDWQLPGSWAIRERTVYPAQNGSIILLHDGGGFRGQTVAALPGIIVGLQRRGFELVTVSQVLGERMLLKP
jgi:peptidoglycan/xylan/chitin deacetylase (PgdA/CDA1 family)